MGEVARGWSTVEYAAPRIRRGWFPREWGEGGQQEEWKETRPRESREGGAAGGAEGKPRWMKVGRRRQTGSSEAPGRLLRGAIVNRAKYYP